MNKLIRFSLCLAFLLPVLLQAQSGNANSYLRKFTAEQRKIRSKQVNYYKTLMQGGDEKRLAKNSEMIVSQVNATIMAIQRTPPYQKDSAMRNDYLRVLDLYTIAYTTGFQQLVLTKANMNSSAENFEKYQDAMDLMEGMLDDAEEKWDRLLTYFTGRYNVPAPDDPTAAELFFLREFSAYVQEIRNAVSDTPFLTKEMQKMVKNKEFRDLEDTRKLLNKSLERALVATTKIGPWRDEKQKDDTFLMDAALGYADNVKRLVEVNLKNEIMALEDAALDGKKERTERVAESVNRMLETILKNEADFEKRLTKFVSAYIKE